MIEVKQQEETNMIKSHSQLPMYDTVMEGKVEGKLKLSQKDTGDKRLHIEDMERMYSELVVSWFVQQAECRIVMPCVQIFPVNIDGNSV